MNRLPQILFAMVPVLALAGAGCAGQLDDEARFLDAGSGSGGSSGTGGSTAAGGSSGAGMGGSAGAGMGGSGPNCDYMAILSTCAIPGCHNTATASAGIKLDDQAAIIALIGMKAPSGLCATMSNVLVVNATTPTDSLLYRISADGAPCGIKMPLVGPPLTDPQRACMLSWIQSLPGVTGM